MRRLLVALAFLAAPAQALTPEAKEFIEVTQKLEPVQCEKRKLRRAIALAEAERRDADAKELRARFDTLNRDRETARLEKRLAELERRISNGRGGTRDAEDLEAISFQQRRAFYACD
ncbi:MAG: hypothetical protein ACREUO_10480 [Burkholderiales bacterium]